MIKKILSLVDQKLLRFIIVGCINTVVGTAIMFGLYNLASCSYWVSSAANYFDEYFELFPEQVFYIPE